MRKLKAFNKDLRLFFSKIGILRYDKIIINDSIFDIKFKGLLVIAMLSKLGAGPSMPTREELEEFFKDEVDVD